MKGTLSKIINYAVKFAVRHDGLISLSDQAFIEKCYEVFLERPCDFSGRSHYTGLLESGSSRFTVINEIVTSKEYKNRLLNSFSLPEKHLSIQDITQLRPDSYIKTKDIQTGADVLAYEAKKAEDFDWLENAILEHGYYDRMNTWIMGVDDDKHMLADMAVCFSPSCCLEIGCASGPVMHLLEKKGIANHGVEISHLAMLMAGKEERKRIHFGDLLNLSLRPVYDLILAMDIFEHFNPNRLKDYIAECFRLLAPGGHLLTNIPSYGVDRIFGQVHEMILAEWIQSAEQGKPFKTIQVDDNGWPIHGHLIWAATNWWERQFTTAGFVRDDAREKSLHNQFDHLMQGGSRARRSFYAFSKPISAIAK